MDCTCSPNLIRSCIWMLYCLTLFSFYPGLVLLLKIQFALPQLKLIIHSRKPFAVGDSVLTAPADRISQILIEVSKIGFRIKDAVAKPIVDPFDHVQSRRNERFELIL